MGRHRQVRISMRNLNVQTIPEPQDQNQEELHSSSSIHSEHNDLSSQNIGQHTQSSGNNLPSIDKSWITLERRKSLRYARGAMSFIEFASKCQTKRGKIKCPCKKCCNVELHHKDEVFEHIICHGFLRGYVHWVWHGEGIGTSTAQNVSNKQEGAFQHDMHGLLNDAFCMHAPEANVNVDPVETNTSTAEEHPVQCKSRNSDADVFFNKGRSESWSKNYELLTKRRMKYWQTKIKMKRK